MQALRGRGHLIISILLGGELEVLLVTVQVCIYRGVSGIHC